LAEALEKAAVERRAARAEHRMLRRDHAFLERRRRDDDLECRSWRIPSLDRAILQRPQLVGVERCPRGAIDAGREIIRIERRKTGQRQDFTRLRLEYDCRSVEAVIAERI